MVTKQNIVEAAFKLFAIKGFYETTTGNIADSLGIKKQSLYSHFNSKEDIFREILQDQSKLMLNEIGSKTKVLANSSTDDLLHGIARSYVSLFANRERLLLWKRITLMSVNPENSDLFSGVSQFDQAFRSDLSLLVNRDYPLVCQHDFDHFFVSYMIMIWGYMEWMLFNNHSEAIFNDIWCHFWDGAKNVLTRGHSL